MVVPEVVVWEEDSADALSVDYGRLTALLIEAVKEQQGQIRALRAELDNLVEQREHQTAEVVRLRATVDGR